MFVYVGVSKLIIVFKKIKTNRPKTTKTCYLEHLTLTHLALHAGVILCCSVQMIKDAPQLAWCLDRSFPSCDLVT